MSQEISILETFRKEGGSMTLGEILKHSWGYEFRARASSLRRKGYVITCERGEKPSQNLYRVIPPEENGQMRIAI